MSRPPTLPLLATAAEEHNLEDDDSDEEMFTVPEMEEKGEDTREMVSQGSLQSSNNNNNNNGGGGGGGGEQVASVKRRRGRNPVDKEYRRLKRLLRNRVSAQQAREKKKVYVNDLESRAKELEHNSFRLEEKISILTNENTMLRKVLMNSRAKVDENEDTKHG